MVKVAGYVRVSTAEQAEEGYSIDAQENIIRQECKLKGNEVVRIYADKGISGKSIKNRLELQQMLKDAEEEKFNEIWVWKTNRLARNQYDLLTIIKKLEKYNVGFKSCSEAFDTSTSAGKLMMNVLSSIGEFERETIVDNVKMGMKQRARTGKWNGGIVLGYKSVLISESETSLKVVPEEAAIVKKIFELYSSGKGLKAISNKLNHEGYKTKRGNMFSTSAIKDILMNPTYVGKIRYNVRENWSEKRRKGINKNPIIVDGEHEAIISMELWNKVQELYKIKSFKPKKAFESNYLLTGLMKCPQCGASMVAGRTKNKLKSGKYRITRYYVCGNWRSKGSAACHSNGIRADYAEKYVLSRIKKVLLNEKILKDIVNNLNKKRHEIIKPLESEIGQLNSNLASMTKKKDRIFDLYTDGIINKEELSERIDKITKDIDDFSERKEKVRRELENNDSGSISYETVRNILSDFSSLLKIAAPEDQKTLLQVIIKKITIKDRKKIDGIELHFDEKIRKYFIKLREGESPGDGGSPSFSVFTICI
ncbi:recombinase family protein [Clostridium autoethanogenum]|uniref:Recombinase family protein n=1 Tax=Clostridium autoethanogenum TaxID=84023 RepID=A0A3M0SX91_9CLOT|nr:recombinase family protein [Clostridium autoethanogenum]RMD02321.1 recombinase family protein [Clostridium autoethanogenum]